MAYIDSLGKPARSPHRVVTRLLCPLAWEFMLQVLALCRIALRKRQWLNIGKVCAAAPPRGAVDLGRGSGRSRQDGPPKVPGQLTARHWQLERWDSGAETAGSYQPAACPEDSPKHNPSQDLPENPLPSAASPSHPQPSAAQGYRMSRYAAIHRNPQGGGGGGWTPAPRRSKWSRTKGWWADSPARPSSSPARPRASA
ncbi:hypothetical protein LX36DRAFT_247265 [Colletotrichum falcatum]|nr:hypothetical protein LX36DRAFT_247265 [Colletotrichum falcatum]